MKLEFPVLVQNRLINNILQYQLRPLFVPSPIITARRYDTAVQRLRSAMKNRFKNYEVNRLSQQLLLWYTFHPEVDFSQEKLQIPLGKDFFDGEVSVARFWVKNREMVCLPDFNHFLCFRKPEDANFRQSLQKVIEKLLKKDRKEYPDDFNVANYYAIRGEFLIIHEQNIAVKSSPFRLDAFSSVFSFDSFSQSQDFDGAVEIEEAGTNLNDKYPDELLRAFEREPQVSRLSELIYNSAHIPLVLLGKEGTGKHSLLHETIFQRHQKKQTNRKVRNPPVWLLDPNRIISGMSIVGSWQKRVEAILEYALHPGSYQKQESCKIVFDNPIALLRIGRSAQNSMAISDVLRPWLEKRKLQIILLATPAEWQVVQEKDRGFAHLFQVLRLPEANVPTAVKMVLEQRKLLENRYQCQISSQAIQGLFNIHRNYLKDKALPGGVMKLLRQLVARYKFGTIDLPQIREEFQQLSGLEIAIFDNAYKFEKDEVRQKIGTQLIGQPKAVETLTEVIHTVKAKLNNPDRPLGSFLFVGPTGVGKTQAAKVLTEYLTGSEKNLMRFDMNEFIDESAVHRLIGSYAQPEGQLTSKIRYNPFGVLLLDEIEKANPRVHDILLQVLDDGRLTDSVGKTVDFTNTIIIMTSNVGAEDIGRQAGFGQLPDADGAIYTQAIKRTFRPEFINRIGRVVIFQSLSLEHILNIARLQIKELLQRDGFVRRSTILNISQGALEWVARRGYDARMGGRALKRQIERDLTALSAEQLVKTTHHQPVIFDIYQENGQLKPRISPLEFVDALPEELLPQLPEVGMGRKKYGQLLREVENIEKKINRLEADDKPEDALIIIGNQESEELDWQYYHFKNQVAQLKEQLQYMMLGYHDQHFQHPPAITLRLKRIKHSSAIPNRAEAWGKYHRNMLKDQLFQQEGLQEINEFYQHSRDQFDKAGSEYLKYYYQVVLLKLKAQAFLEKKSDLVIISIESAITGQGKPQINYLLDLYEKTLQLLEVKTQLKGRKQQIVAEEFALYDFMKKEEGIHLFYDAQKRLLPLKVNIARRHQQAADSTRQPFKIIRVYHENRTLTDIRTGFSNTFNISAEEFKIMLLAGE